MLVNPPWEAGLDPIWRDKDTEELAGKNNLARVVDEGRRRGFVRAEK